MIVLPTGFFGATATPFPPTGCLCWLKDDVTLTSGKVSSWTDMSGSGNHFVQTVAANRPTQVAAVQNGNPGILFDDATQQWLTCNPFLVNGDSAEVFIVLCGLHIPSTSNFGPWAFGTTGYIDCWDYGSQCYTDWGTDIRQNWAEAQCDDWAILNIESSMHDWEARVDDASRATSITSHSAWPAGADSFKLGAGLGAYYWHGYIGEFLVFKPSLSAPDRATVFSYLQTKWATP